MATSPCALQVWLLHPRDRSTATISDQSHIRISRNVTYRNTQDESVIHIYYNMNYRIEYVFAVEDCSYHPTHDTRMLQLERVTSTLGEYALLFCILRILCIRW